MISLEIPNSIISDFKKQAKEAFPKETLVYLYGTWDSFTITVEGMYVPDDLEKYCTNNQILIQPHWAVEAEMDAKENDAVVVGDLHSHPYTYDDLSFIGGIGHEQSQSDLDSRMLDWQKISGICVVKETKNGVLRSSVRFWGPTLPLIVTTEKVVGTTRNRK